MSTTRTDFGGDELSTPEGFRFRPFVEVTRDESGAVVGVRVGIVAQDDTTDTYRTVSLVPSTATGEGDGTGNVFVYEDDDALTHVAWGTTDDDEDDDAPWWEALPAGVTPADPAPYVGHRGDWDRSAVAYDGEHREYSPREERGTTTTTTESSTR